MKIYTLGSIFSVGIFHFLSLVSTSLELRFSSFVGDFCINEAPRGKRNEASEYYRESQHFSSEIREPDRVNSSFMGYFRIPAIWLEEKPESDIAARDLVQHNKLSNGIIINAFRDGFFVFDFRDSNYGKQIFVPGYTYPQPRFPHRRPEITEEALREVNKSILERARLINAHQCLMTQAERDVARRGAHTGFPVAPRDLTRSINREGCLDYRPHPENFHSIARSYFFQKPLDEERGQRRIVEIEVVEHAANLLERVFQADGAKAISLIDQLFIAQSHGKESRSGIALVAIWTVIEHFIYVDWKKILENHGVQGSRKQKLIGRDFTSSIILENMELMGVYEKDLFQAIDQCRKARNGWMHELKEPSSQDLHYCGVAINKLIYRHYKIDLAYHVSNFSGSDAQWPIWLDGGTKKKFD